MNSPDNIIRASLEECPALAGQPLAFIGLGANLDSAAGSPADTLRQAFVHLAQLSDQPILVSSLWQTFPLDCPPGSPLFLNAVAALVPENLDPEGLLQALQHIENTLGRVRTGVQNAPRTLDLDLLSFGQQTRTGSFLTLPHPRMHERRFVLEPLLEIAPDYVIPGKGPAKALLEETAFQGTISPINSAHSL